MKITVYMAVSVDGRITKGETDSEWVSPSDWNEFNNYINSNDAIVMGRKTMEQFEDNFPIDGAYNVVLSRNPSLHFETDRSIILSANPNEVVDMLVNKNHQNILVIGGASVNEQFLKVGLVDELIVSVHPLLIGEGLGIFGSKMLDIPLQLLNSKIVNSELVQIVYAVKKKL